MSTTYFEEVRDLANKLCTMSCAARHSAKEQVDAFESGKEWGRAIGMVDAAGLAMDLALKMREAELASDKPAPQEATRKVGFWARLFWRA